jgi:translocation and assembly module TamB
MNAPVPPSPQAAPLRRSFARAWRVLLVALVIAVGLALNSSRVLTVLLQLGVPSLSFSELRGSLLRGVELQRPVYQSSALTLRASRLALQWQAGWRSGLLLSEVRATDLVVEVRDSKDSKAPAWPQLPFSLRITRLAVDGLTIVRGAQRYQYRDLEAALTMRAQHINLSRFVLRAPEQSLRGHARYDGALDALFEWQGPLAGRDGRVLLRAHGALDAVALELQLKSPWLATVRGEADVRAVPPRFKGALSADVPTVGAISGELNGALEGAHLQLQMPFASGPAALRDIQLEANVSRATDHLNADLRWQVGAAPSLQGDGRLRLDARGLDVALDSAAPSATTLRARLLFAADGAELGARVRWQDVPLPGLTPATLTRGALKLRGALTDLRVSGALRAADSSVGGFDVDWRGRLTPQQFEFGQLRSTVLAGHVRARGTLDWQERLCTRFIFDFAALDFAHLDAQFSSTLEGLGRGHGCRMAQRWQGGITFERVSGRWRGQPLRARGEFEQTDARSGLHALHVELGTNVLDAELELAPTLAGRFKLAAPQLGALATNLAGRLEADGEVGGSVAAPLLRARMTGSGLAFGAWQAATLDGHIDIDASRLSASRLSLALNDFAHQKTALGQLRVNAEGTAAAHHVTLAVQGGAFESELALDGAWAAPLWSGTLATLSFDTPGSGPWRLAQATALTVHAGRWTFGPGCLSQDSAQVCATLNDWSAQAGAAELRLRAVPLALLREWFPASLEPRGKLNGEAQLAKLAGQWQGQGKLSIARGQVRYRAAGEPEQTLPLKAAAGTFQLAGERLRAEAALEVGEWFRLRAEFDGGLAPDAALRSDLVFTAPDIHWLEEFVPELAGSHGSAELRTHVQGSRAAPHFKGELVMSAGRLLLPRFGTELAALKLSAEGTPDTELAVAGQAEIGAGTLHMTGTFNPRGVAGARLALHLRGEQLALVRLPDIEADAAPDIELSLAAARCDLHGQVNWSRVQIHLPSLPERAVVTSPDEVLVGGEVAGEAPRPRQRWFVDTLAADLDFTLGDEVELSAAGMDAKLNGAVHWNKPRGDARGRGRGGLNIVDGHYKAYGQDLDIQRGALIFDGPIDNPALDVRAIRPDLEVTAGVRVSGNLRLPKFALFAEPSMPDAEVLSYLVTGHALANASSGEAGVIARAALSLGADRAALVTSQLSNLFALDEFGINPGRNARTSSIVAGKRLTPKLTVRSEFNPFERVWSFFLNYKLSPRWSVEAQTGAGQGADVIYSVERDRLGGTGPLTPDPAPLPPSP